MTALLEPAAEAFDSIAGAFDTHYGQWRSVAAQRAAVRASLMRAFPVGARVLELGGGTAEDATWLTHQDRVVTMTDVSPAMVRIAEGKLRSLGAPQPGVVDAGRLDDFVPQILAANGSRFDGAFSNFAGLNCVTDLARTARGLAQLVRPGGHAVLVVFGTASIGELVVQLVLRNPRAAIRRMSKSDVPARLGGRSFTVRYHRRGDLVRAMAPWFRLVSTKGIGVFVPPSAAEPWISSYPRVVRAMELADEVVSGVLAPLGDHILYAFERTSVVTYS
jgi:Methylase involved in ubiquinone/menaquinone biosynthesis